MTESHTARLRNVLREYEQQLLMARRIARFRAKKRLAEGLPPQDRDPSVQRRQYVESVARELYDHMIFTGSENPMVREIRRQLGLELKKEVRFSYPPGGQLCILAEHEGEWLPLEPLEQKLAREALRRITSQKVDESMLKKPPRVGVCCQA